LRHGAIAAVTEIHHFAYGWINPTLAYVMSFLGSLLGLILTARAREASGRRRLRWLVLAGIAIGGTGIWLMHFMAMLGFDVPASVVRLDVLTTIASMVIAVVIVTLGLFVVGFGRRSVLRIIGGGLFTGLGVAAMHYTGMAALRVGGRITYDLRIVALSVAIAVVASAVALWFAVVISGSIATIGAAAVMGLAVCGMHYTAMAAVHVQLDDSPIDGAVGPFVLLTPISILACVVITTLAYATVDLSMRHENAREDRFFDENGASAFGRPAQYARHR
jgi:NO-binding membrane sensor protein with MHYT domain